MNSRHSIYGRSARFTALGMTLSLAASTLAGCSQSNTRATPPPVDDTRGARQTYPAEQPRRGMSTGQKVAILAGAAALYYLYNKHKNARGEGPRGQYYLSKNGRVYYRDREGRAHWVTPPREGIRVPAEEAEQYSRYRGYNGRETGETFGGYGADADDSLLAPSGPPGPRGR